MNSNTPAIGMLLAVGIISGLGVKVPTGVDPVLSWGSAIAVAALIALVGVVLATSRQARIAAGYFFVALLLGFAGYIVATLPPYQAPVSLERAK